MEVFGSPLPSPSQFTSCTVKAVENVYLLRGVEIDTKIDGSQTKIMESQDSEVKSGHKYSFFTPDNFYIHLSPHAALCTPVQSDSTNIVLSSSNLTPDVTTYRDSNAHRHNFSSLYKSPEKFTQVSSPLSISPPLTRSAARR